MQTLAELGEAVSTRRKALGLNQSVVSLRSGITRESLVRFEEDRYRSSVPANSWRYSPCLALK
jgi:transcriptional regulator with XRE-family HTH domain